MNTTDINTKPTNLFKSLVQQSQSRQKWYGSGQARIYLLKVTHLKGKAKVVNDTFLKIGFSGENDVENRIAYMPACFDVEVLEAVIFDKDIAKRLEMRLHRHYRRYKYTPKHKKWGGSQECYRMELLTDYDSLADLIEGLSIVQEVEGSPTSL